MAWKKKTQICAESCKYVQKAPLGNTPFSYTAFEDQILTPTPQPQNSPY